VEKGLWEKGVRKDASAKGLGPRNRVKRRVYAKKGEGVFFVKRGKGGSASIREGPTEKRVYSTLQVTTNVASTLRGKKGWQKEDGARLSSYKSIDGKKWIPLATHHRYLGRSRKKEGVHKAGSEMGL